VAVAVRVVMINLPLMLLRPRSIIGGITGYYACWAELPTPIGEIEGVPCFS
jgi:hypothetical protein